MGGLTRVQQDLQLYCPFVDVPELEPLHEVIEAAKDDRYLASSSDRRRSRTGRGNAASTFVVTFSFDESISSTVGRSTVLVTTDGGAVRARSLATRLIAIGVGIS